MIWVWESDTSAYMVGAKNTHHGSCVLKVLGEPWLGLRTRREAIEEIHPVGKVSRSKSKL